RYFIHTRNSGTLITMQATPRHEFAVEVCSGACEAPCDRRLGSQVVEHGCGLYTGFCRSPEAMVA
ncbi:MAG: hypothetical protein ACKO0V_22295, partial [bacterium]